MVQVLLFYLDNEHNKTRWQFQLVEPHVITADALQNLKHWRAEYRKQVSLHDSNFTLRSRLHAISDLAKDLEQHFHSKISPSNTQPTQAT